MLKKNENGEWIDAEGQAVPVKYVPDDDKLRTRVVNKIEKKFRRIRKNMQEFADYCKDEIGKYCEKRELGDVSELSLELADFSQNFMIQIKRAKSVKENDNLIKLQTGLQNFIKEKYPQGDDFLLEMVDRAFHRQNGRIDPQQVRKLKRYKHKYSKDPKWLELMELIDVCFDVVNIKQYMRFYEKGQDGHFRNIHANLSKM